MFTLTETERNLYKAILTEPDNDVPRLMLADELLANSTPSDPPGGREHFARFVATQVEWSQTPECPRCGDTGVIPAPDRRPISHPSTDYRDLCLICVHGSSHQRQQHLRLKFEANSLLSMFGDSWFPGRSRLTGFGREAESGVAAHPALVFRPEPPHLVVRRGFPDEVQGFFVHDWLSRPGGPVAPGPNPCGEVALPYLGLGGALLLQYPTLRRATPWDTLEYQMRGRTPVLTWTWLPSLLSLMGLPQALNKHFVTMFEARDAMSEYLISEAKNFLSRYPSVVHFDSIGPFSGVALTPTA